MRYFLHGVIAIGLLMSMAGLFLSADTGLDLRIPVYALLTAVPFLLLAKLARQATPAESLVGGMLLLLVSSWAYLREPDQLQGVVLVVLPLYLSGMVAAVFLLGRLLRSFGSSDEESPKREDRQERRRPSR